MARFLMRLRRRIKRLVPDIVLDWHANIRAHRRAHGDFPRLFRPRTFNEKILHRSLIDRRRIFHQLADKAAVRTYVQERWGAAILPEIYHLTKDPRTIPFAYLPERFAVKPTHGSSWVIVVPDKSQCEPDQIVAQAQVWLASDYYRQTREFPYRGIVPQIIVQEFIDDGSGGPPSDYRFFVFGGKAEAIRVDAERVTNRCHRCIHFSRDWQKLDVRIRGWGEWSQPLPKPARLEEMIAIAESLAAGLDFIRVDLFCTPQRIYFGEMTCTPGGGCNRYVPVAFDRYLGDLWPRQRRRGTSRPTSAPPRSWPLASE